jgi:hypothetical protein
MSVSQALGTWKTPKYAIITSLVMVAFNSYVSIKETQFNVHTSLTIVFKDI